MHHNQHPRGAAPTPGAAPSRPDWYDARAYRPDPVELLRRSGYARTYRDDVDDLIFAVRAQPWLAVVCTSVGFLAGMLGVIVPALIVAAFQ